MPEQFQKTINKFTKAPQIQAQDQLMKNQHEFLLLLSQNIKSSGVLPETTEVSEEFSMETLGNGITEFHYDPESNVYSSVRKLHSNRDSPTIAGTVARCISPRILVIRIIHVKTAGKLVIKRGTVAGIRGGTTSLSTGAT
ncbi:hypothetical protein JTB14_033428 [Gonioctena quinquepunctata]|nr:hypothetical protein JTB14_033428 [Gonioctena quinquepunctata]